MTNKSMTNKKSIVSFANENIEERAIRLEHETLCAGGRSIAMILPLKDGRSIAVYHSQFLDVLEKKEVSYFLHGIDEMKEQMEPEVYKMLSAVMGIYR